jgi:hypothetical protein
MMVHNEGGISLIAGDTCSFKEEGTNYPEEFGAKAANTYFKAPLKNKEAFDHMNTEQGPTAT